MATETKPAVEGWFTTGDAPQLIGARCTTCGTLVFPATKAACPNPACRGAEFADHPLSRTGRVWSCTTNHYQPPEPYKAPEVFEPYSVLAVELDGDAMTVLGQLDGEPGDIRVGDPVELVVGTLYEEDGVEHLVWRWRKASNAGGAA